MSLNHLLKIENWELKILLFCIVFLMFASVGRKAEAATIARPMQSLGLVGYWSFDVGKGTAKAFDMSGRGNNGTLTNMNTTAAWVGGKIGNALDFDGSDDYIKVTSPSGLPTDDFTLSAWINLDSNSDEAIVSIPFQAGSAPLGVYEQDELLLYVNSSNKLEVSTNNAVRATSNSSISTGKWVHIVTSRSSGNIKLYIDGTSDGSGTDSVVFTNITCGLYIGSDPHSTAGVCPAVIENFTDGLIDEVRVYNRALSADEIKRLYRQTSPQMNASQANKLRQGLVGMWTFDGNDMGTTSARDASGAGNTGWLVNGAKKAIGRIGQALNFDGVDDYVLVADADSLDMTGSMTITLWLHTRTSGVDHVIWKTNDSFNAGYRWEVSAASYLRFTTANGSGVTNADVTTLPYTQNQWHFLAVVYNGSTATFYVDNRSASTPLTRNPAAGTDKFYIGSRPPNLYSNGLIDEVRIYNRALTPAEIRQLYKAGSSFHPNVTNKSSIRDGLVGHWSFDGADMGTTSARDSSGAGNTGWLINGTKKTVGKVGQALSFDGVDDLVDVGSASSLDNITVKTLAAWIYPRTHGENNTGQIIQKEENSNQWRLQIDNNSAACQGGGGQKICFRQQFSTMAGVWRSANNTVPLNTWTHVAVVYDRGSTANDPVFYINGVSVAITEQTTPSGDVADDNTLRTSIGARRDNGGSAFDGLIDEVRIYNRALSPAEIKRLYNMGR